MIKQFEEKMIKSVDNLSEEYQSIRAGRANPHIVDKIKVEYYGQPSPIQSVANISVPEARVIQIQPWDSSLIKEIEKAIMISDIGITPSNDGKVIRLVFPELTEERRKELVKDIRKIAEESKVAVRAIRRDGMDEAKEMEKESLITEDDLKRAEDQIQKLTDKKIAEIDEMTDKKENEIMSV
jgi:ribosome recycling factor